VIAVVCAVPAERRALEALAGPELEIHVAGIGADATERAAASLTARPLRALVSAGFCGALSPDLRVGDLVAPDRVRDEASGESFEPDPEMLAAAPGARGTLVSARRIARTPDERARLQGVAVDLESAALARAARDAGVPFLALRAVTDEARHRLPDFDRLMDAAGRLTPGAGLLHFLRHPREVPALVRLGPAARVAGRALRAGLEQTLGRLR
jgi:adenosylhomocysteine nucleosidase